MLAWRFLDRGRILTTLQRFFDMGRRQKSYLSPHVAFPRQGSHSRQLFAVFSTGVAFKRLRGVFSTGVAFQALYSVSSTGVALERPWRVSSTGVAFSTHACFCHSVERFCIFRLHNAYERVVLCVNTRGFCKLLPK